MGASLPFPASSPSSPCPHRPNSSAGPQPPSSLSSLLSQASRKHVFTPQSHSGSLPPSDPGASVPPALNSPWEPAPLLPGKVPPGIPSAPLQTQAFPKGLALASSLLSPCCSCTLQLTPIPPSGTPPSVWAATTALSPDSVLSDERSRPAGPQRPAPKLLSLLASPLPPGAQARSPGALLTFLPHRAVRSPSSRCNALAQ